MDVFEVMDQRALMIDDTEAAQGYWEITFFSAISSVHKLEY